jgi:hypothetical protein
MISVVWLECAKIRLYEDAFHGGTFIRSNLITYRKEVKNFKMQIHSYDLSEAWLDN